ncbi:MAG: hypothetical protein KDB50_13550 [Mycobacterium sp.]|nr:hypothetical protein [Mycobacterium sp.]
MNGWTFKRIVMVVGLSAAALTAASAEDRSVDMTAAPPSQSSTVLPGAHAAASHNWSPLSGLN